MAVHFRWFELLASVWLISAPFVVGYVGAPYINEVAVGLLAAVVTLVRWQDDEVWWALLPFGIWLLVSAPLLGYENLRAAVLTELSVGAVFTAGALHRVRRARRRGPSSP